MAEIKFTVDNMVQIHNRLNGMIQQLHSSISATGESLDSISDNIMNDDINKILKDFVVLSKNSYYRIKSHLVSLDEYLAEKIENYTFINNEGVDAMTEVQEQLNQFN